MRQDQLKTIKEVISAKSGFEERNLMMDSLFAEDLNLTDLELGEILTELEEKLDVEIKVDVEDIKTVGELISSFSDVLE